MIKAKHLLEYGLLRAFAFFARVAPYRAALAAGWIFAFAAHYILRFRTESARRRIREVFGCDAAGPGARRIAWLAWRNFVFNAIDFLRIPAMPPAKSAEAVKDSDSIAPLLEHSRSGRGAIIATMHMGAWEMAIIKCLQYRLPVFSLAAKQKNPLTDAYINRIRAATGFETVLRGPAASREIIRRLREGRALAILSDVRSPAPGINVNFLGRNANVAWGMGMLAHMENCPVFPVVIRRAGWTGHAFRVYPAVMPDMALEKRGDAARITQAVFDIFDKCARETPEQWFWFNKRWLFEPLPAQQKKGAGGNAE